MPDNKAASCPSCGARMKENSTHCDVCGSDLTGVDENFQAVEGDTPPRGALDSRKNFFSGSQAVIITSIVAALALGGISFGISRFVIGQERKKAPAQAEQSQQGQPPQISEEDIAAAHQALNSVRDSLDKDPNNPRLLLRLANLYYDTKKFSDAEPLYARYLKEFDPKNANVRVDYSYALFQNGKQDAGIKELKDLLKTEPENSFALFNLGVMHYERKEMAEAKEYFLRCSKVAPEGSQIQQMAQKILQQGFNTSES